ncbi:MAG TPA: hypothetical protein VIG99_20240 [Myxococcaceae bacterium]|jgi:hypothetical protein
MATPLIFDLTGSSPVIRAAEMVREDVDGDGFQEVVTDVAFGTGLLVLDPVRLGERRACVHNGFEALRALAEDFARVGGDKQHLDAADLAFLEEQVGLRMRVGGFSGGDVRFAELGITRIDLGDPEQIDSVDGAAADLFGNRYLRQAGARFTVRGQVREYVGIRFRVQARVALDLWGGRLAAA